MQQREIISMMGARRVQGIGDEAGLRKLAEKYPYCSTFQVLNAINLKEQDSIDFKSQLNRAAIAIQDRSKLCDYIVKENLLSRIEASVTESEERGLPEILEATASQPEPVTHPEEEINPQDVSDSETSSELLIPDGFENPQHCKAETLSDQIMREAFSHLGEIESDMRMKELAMDSVEDSSVALPKKDIREEPLSFGAWLLQKNSP